MVACALAVLLPTMALAQAKLCFRPRPLPSCSNFVLFELDGELRLAGTSHVVGPTTQQDLQSFGGWRVGAMHNLDSTHALGAAAHVGFDDQGVRLALEAQRRTWLSPTTSLDLSAGPITTQQQNVGGTDGTTQAYGLTAGAAIGARDLIGLRASADLTNGHGHTAVALHVGGNLRSTTAVIGSAVVGALGILVVAALRQGYST